MVSGGSGGHLFPAYALAEEMGKRMGSLRIMLAISGKPEEGGIIEYIKDKLKNLKIYIVPVLPLNKKGGFFYWFIFLSHFIIGSIYSFLLILFLHPSIVVGFGGLLSLPLIFSAFLLRIPTLVHEQNLYPGKANRLLYYFAEKVALSFEESKFYFKNKNKLVITGNPLRPDLKIRDKKESLKKLGLNPSSFTVLILGGSQGASSLNRYFTSLWENWKRENGGIQVIHITGLKDWDWVSRRYRDIDIPARLFPFCEEMGIVYSAADLIISRAGASTLNELSFFAKPTIVIPYPYAEQHQFHNAFYYLQRGGVLLLEERDLFKENTQDFIRNIIRDRDKQSLLSREIKKLNNPSSAKLLADLVEEILNIN